MNKIIIGYYTLRLNEDQNFANADVAAAGLPFKNYMHNLCSVLNDVFDMVDRFIPLLAEPIHSMLYFYFLIYNFPDKIICQWAWVFVKNISTE